MRSRLQADSPNTDHSRPRYYLFLLVVFFLPAVLFLAPVFLAALLRAVDFFAPVLFRLVVAIDQLL